MTYNNHSNFILTSITKILEEAILASAGIEDGIENYAINDYILHSVFLKMTGAQEQKMKCICWELATNDYQYRYNRYSKWELGECSEYKHKFHIYKDLIDQIKKSVPDFNVQVFFDKHRDNIAQQKINNKIIDIFSESIFANFSRKHLITFSNNKIDKNHFGKNSNLLENKLQERYKQLYNHRNRCAHNTLSYQQNLPTFDTLKRDDYIYENYIVYFSILILIDEIMMKLYEKYLEVIE